VFEVVEGEDDEEEEEAEAEGAPKVKTGVVVGCVAPNTVAEDADVEAGVNVNANVDDVMLGFVVSVVV